MAFLSTSCAARRCRPRRYWLPRVKPALLNERCTAQKKTLRVVSGKRGFEAGWVWRLSPTTLKEDCQEGRRLTGFPIEELGNEGHLRDDPVIKDD